ncbi:hypothetical protein FRACYDRAFT_192784 [Fragilariopsis cylindrus CCMP1102]|uniref:FAD-binding domain-containing protein n=1 Tax=Fragilariopsis cylindrus CCMP1102 TaxID=635003 RepID=A0A1E7EZP8_9STRA|nr:hypothetical protein FRACYDRAFT_192784 [Fragilariopsis cylindrus CCMP1102]|eukprot:OEU11337.1 hypothetical protein FRACYDRAFT_192784 [Fragilariopsis cylindrus CCMP1102]
MSLAAVLLLLVAVSVQAFPTTGNHHHPRSVSTSTSTSSSTSILHSDVGDVVGSASGDHDEHEREKAIVVGGGPVGLSAALVLANRGYDVSLFEATSTDEIKTFNPALAYLYNINDRGQTFTTMFPTSIHEKLVEWSVASTDTGFMVASGDGKEDIQFPKLPNFGVTTPSYWIPRHKMTVLMWNAVDEHNNNKARAGDNNNNNNSNNLVGNINYEQGVSCVNVYPSSSPSDNNNENDSRNCNRNLISVGKLVVGADGIRSKVRECLKKRTGLFGSWHYKERKFQIRKWASPATGLKLKVLQVPTNKYSLIDSDGTKIATNNTDFVVVRGKNNGPLDNLNLGCLPVQDSLAIRQANCITRPNHVLWTMNTGDEVKAWFKDNYRSRLDLDDLISDHEWDRFAKAKGNTFPPCQYSPGLQASSDNGECGVVLLGDAAHAFSPDIGQGINAGLMDVVQFDKILAKTHNDDDRSVEGSLGRALTEYERIQAPETRALIRLARFGSPYQYNQPLRKDRLGKKLWTVNIAMRVILNKVTMGIFPKPMILNASSNKMTYRKLVRQADMGTAVLMSVLAFSLFKLFARTIL